MRGGPAGGAGGVQGAERHRLLQGGRHRHHHGGQEWPQALKVKYHYNKYVTA